MARIVFNPTSFGPSGLAQIVPIKLGGTGANNVAGAVSNLQLVSKSELNSGATGVAGLDANSKVKVSQLPTGAGGVVLLDPNGAIPASYVPSGLVSKIVTLNGPTTVAVGQTATYTITNYDQFTTYNVSVSGGSAGVSAGVVTLTAPSTTGQITLTINSVSFTINVVASVVNTPTITAPGNNVQGVSLKPTFTKSTFSVTGQAQTQTSVRWELSTTPTFTTLVDYYEGTSNYTSWMPSVMLSSLTTYYVRVKDQGSVSGYSNWSPVVSFTTVQQVNFVTTIGGSGDEFLREMIKLGSYLYAVGVQSSQGQGGYDAIVVKYDLSGNLIWQRGLGGSGNEAFSSITTDGSYLYVGGNQSTRSQSTYDPLIAKFDLNGNLIWQRSIGVAGTGSYDTITTDGTYLYVAGGQNAQGQGGDIFIAKYDIDGNLIWQRGLGGASLDYGYNIITLNGNLYLVGYQASQDSGNNDALLCKYDTNGNLVWQRALGGSGDDQFYAVTTDGTYLYTVGNLTPSGRSDRDALITKYDTNGNLIWQRGLGGSGIDYFNTVTTDGTYLYAAGIQNTQSQSGNDAIIAKYDTNGSLIWQRGITGASEFYLRSCATDGVYVYFSGYIGLGGSAGNEATIISVPTNGSIAIGPLTGSGLTTLSWTQPTLSSYTSTLSTYATSLGAYVPTLSPYDPALTAYVTSLSTRYSNY